MIRNMETKRKRIGIWIAAALIISVVVGLLWNGSRDAVYAKEVFVETETLVQEKVSAGKAFTVLEIVSAQENARFGYLVGGCEPNLYGAGMKDTLIAEGLMTADVNSSIEYPITYMGVEVQEFDTPQPDLVSAGYVESQVTTTVSGSDASGNAISGNDITTTVYRYEKDSYRNNEVFKKYVLGMSGDYAKLNVQVVTKTPADLTVADIESADLIYISGKGVDTYASVQFSSDDMAKTLVSKIARGDSRIPCIIDYTIFENIDANKNANLYRICAVFLSEFPEKAYTSIEANWATATDADAWSQIISTHKIGNSGHFIRENIYWYRYNAADYTKTNSAAGQICFVNNDIASYFSATAIGSGFTEVVTAIDVENYNNSVNYPNREAMNTNNITQALAVQYILKYNTNANIIYKNAISVLEIQPCKEFDFDDAAGKTAMIQKWLPTFENNQSAVTVTCMTMAEFIGLNEDVCEEYDLIYIGSNTDWFNVITYDGRTYREMKDKSMTGMVYSHVGDLGNLYHHWGLIATDTGTDNKMEYRFTGIDLTTYKLEDLKNFLDSGSPIIVADDFFNYNNSNAIVANGTPTAINAGTTRTFTGRDGETVYGILDTSSYMYQLVVYGVHGTNATAGQSINGSADWAIDWNSRAYKNFLYESGANENTLLSSINQQKLYLNLALRPTEYTYRTAGTYGYITSSTYLKPASDGNYYLTYEFSISSLGVAASNQTYDCQLFIDVNNDGKFSKTQEEMDSLVITEISTGTRLSPVSGKYQLRAGVAYRMQRVLPAEYMGCIAWDLVCTSNSNADIHASESGYTLVKESGTEKQKLKILQITSGTQPDMTDRGTYPYNINNINLQAELEQGTSVWGELLYNVPDFELDITTIPTYGDNGVIAKFNADSEYLEQFDMLIFGFSDGFSDIRYDKLLAAIEDYANSGHCVMFSHDTTFQNYGKLSGLEYTTAGVTVPLDTVGSTTPATTKFYTFDDDDMSSRYIDLLIRKLSGMDSYGVTVNGPVRSGSELTVGTAAWNTVVATGKDMAFKPNTYQTQTVPNTQGATNIQMRLGLWAATDLWIYEMEDAVWTTPNTKEEGYDSTYGLGSAVVEKVNDGMITNYPYKIPDTFMAANTHGQYWALDLESDEDNDGESDIVVWYTIEDYTTTDNGKFKNDLCSLSPHDVKNNYYIYNKGNITYTGVGHTQVTSEQEVKLFINTMVASYVASVKKPEVKVVEDGTSQASEISNITVPYTDGTVLTENSNNTVRVYFSVYDNNIVKGTKTITGNFYLNGTQIDLSIYSANGTCLYTAGSGNATNVLNSGNVYYVEIPAARLAGHGSMDFDVEIYSDWVRNGEHIQSEKATDTVRITKVELFDLD